MPVIESEERQSEFRRLITDSQIKNMADQVKIALSEEHFTLNDISWGPGEPKMDFMLKCNKEFKRRGGKPPMTIGGVAKAVMHLVTQ